MIEEQKRLREQLLRYLARREYSTLELKTRLLAKGFSVALVEQALEQARARGQQSDERFAACYVRHRAASGFGPLKLRQELKQKGLESACIEQVIAEHQENFIEGLKKLWQKPFTHAKAKQAFLLRRGFPEQYVERVEYENQ